MKLLLINGVIGKKEFVAIFNKELYTKCNVIKGNGIELMYMLIMDWKNAYERD